MGQDKVTCQDLTRYSVIGTPEDQENDWDSEQDVRDQGMSRCFDGDLLRKFIVFLGKVKLNG